MKKTSLLITALLTATWMFAYDFTEKDNYGNTIYFERSLTGANEVTVTNSGSYGSYTGTVEIPEEVLPPGSMPGSDPYKVTAIGLEAFRECHGLTKVIIPTSVREIQNMAFFECDNLTSVIIPGGVQTIYNLAFANCSKLTEVTCLADRKPMLMDSSSFCTKIDTLHLPVEEYYYHEIETLYVPEKKVVDYQSPSMWKECFKNIVGIDCGTSVVESLKSTYAEIKWKPAKDVVLYTINVYSEDNLFAQYIVDGEGNEVSHERYAPAIHKADTTMNTTDYFVITMDNLTPNTGYSYTIHGTNTLNEQVYQDDGAFKTKSRDDEAIESVTRTSSAIRKVIKDGIMIIEHNGSSYSPSGQRQ